MDFLVEITLQKLNYWVYICLMMLGLWAVLCKRNYIKKLMGIGIFQAAVILFYVSMGAKEAGSDIPIYPRDLIHPVHAESGGGHGELPHAEDAHAAIHDLASAATPSAAHSGEAATPSSAYRGEAPFPHKKTHAATAPFIDPDRFDNPLPHVLMLTAIVVGVATLGVALAMTQRLYRLYGSIEEPEVLAAIEAELKVVPHASQTPDEPSRHHA
jgi:multicomponent Na+:H+ antiporter subunit C